LKHQIDAVRELVELNQKYKYSEAAENFERKLHQLEAQQDNQSSATSSVIDSYTNNYSG